MSGVFPPPESLRKPLEVPFKLMMGPGPSNVSPRIAASGTLPILGQTHPEFFKIMDEVKDGLKYTFQTRNDMTLCVSGTGHAAMETACCNLVEEGDVVLVIIAGLWGMRFADMAERHGGVVHRLEKPLGNIFSLQDIGNALQKHRPSVMFVTQGESTSTTLQPLEGLGSLCHSYGCLLVVDSVAAMCGVPLFVDKWEIDVCYSGSQKVLNVPPGVAPITFSPRAREKIARRKTKVRSFYFDMNELGNYWGVPGCGSPIRYHHTAPILTIYAMREGLAIIAEEGLERCWERTNKCWNLLMDELEAMGIVMFVKEKSWRLPTCTAFEVPSGIDWKALSSYVMKKYRIEVGGGLGPTQGKVMRIGMMGYNASVNNVRRIVAALKDGIEWCKGSPQARL